MVTAATLPAARTPGHARRDRSTESREVRCISSPPRRVAKDAISLLTLTPLYGPTCRVRLGYRLIGPSDAPVVVVQGGISADRAVCALPGETDRRPWWPEVVGDGLAVDTRRFRVLCLDWLTPAEYAPIEGVVPRIVTTADQAAALAALLAELGIDRLAAFIGSSYGGMVALAFAARHPDLLDRLVVISAAHRAHPFSTALRQVQRRIVQFGLESGDPEQALAIARQLAMTTFRTPREYLERFGATELNESGALESEVIDYLDAVGEKFATRFDPERFIALSESLDAHSVDPAEIATACTLVSVTSDRLIYPEQLRELARELGVNCRLREIGSPYGHDAFLKETAVISQILATALTF